MATILPAEPGYAVLRRDDVVHSPVVAWKVETDHPGIPHLTALTPAGAWTCGYKGAGLLHPNGAVFFDHRWYKSEEHWRAVEGRQPEEDA
jgi:hypothetical protein